VTASGAAVWENVLAEDLLSADKFQDLLRGLFDQFYLRRMGKLDRSDRPAFDQSDQKLWEKFQEDETPVPKYISSYNGNELRCDRCRLRQPEYLAQTSGERFLLCRSCMYKEVRGSYRQREKSRKQTAEAPYDTGAQTLYEQFVEWGNTSHEHIKMKVDNEIRTTTDLADKNGDVALLYADINNLGGVGGEFKNFPKYRNFRIAVDETVRKALYNMLWCAMELNLSVNEEKELTARFEIIAAGGDDICVLLPGNVALFAGTKMVENFEELWKKNYAKAFEKALGDDARLSLSAGIAVAPDTAPLAYMQMAVEMLLKSAKTRAHELKKEGANHRGALDILLLQGDGQWGVGLDVLRKTKAENNEKAELVRTAEKTMRPFSVEEAKAFLKILRCAEKEPNHMLYTVAEAGDACTIDEGLLYFDYLKSKMRAEVQTDAEQGTVKEGRTGLEKLQQQLKDMLGSRIATHHHEGLYFRLQDDVQDDGDKDTTQVRENAPEKWIFPWRDVVSLQTQKGEEACV
jgi:hypothetical protein